MGLLSFKLADIEYKQMDKWTNYLKGMIHYIQKNYGKLPNGFEIYINGNIPNGASLSSSASLELLIGALVNECFELEIPRLDLVKLGMKTENEFLGLNSGILDQFAVGMAKEKARYVT